MNNSRITELIDHFGLEKTIQFCEMNVFVYDLTYEEVMLYNPELNTMFAYDYERDWWLLRHDELIKQFVLSL